MMARQSKIGFVVRAAVLPGNDVFDVKSVERIAILMHPAILAAIRRAPDHNLSSGG